MSTAQANPTSTYAKFEDRHWWYVGRRHIMCRLVHQLLEASERPLILDVGCGPGANVAALAAEYRCVGIDDAPAAIDQARRRFPAVQFVCGTAPESVPEVAAAADLIVLMDVLEHIGEDKTFLGSLVSQAKPGAHLLITVPADPKMWSPHDEAVGHVRRYGVGDLSALWEDLPVSTQLVSFFNSRLYVPVRLARIAARLRGKGHGGTGAEETDLRLPPKVVNEALTRLFAGEADALLDGLACGRAPYRRGVSLLGILRRTP